jgi:hypothetical protein
MRTRSLILLILLVTLTGCPGRISPATKEGMVVRDYTAPKQTGENIFVKKSTDHSSFFNLGWLPGDDFTAAVKESLLISKAFSALSTNWGDDWGLEIEIRRVDAPFLAFDVTVTTDIKYTVYLKSKKVYETYIRESKTVTVGEEFFGVARTGMAFEKSVQANIKKFIEELSSQKLD